MFNSTKALLSLLVIITFVATVVVTWIITPNHSGVAMSVGLILLPFAGVFLAWINDANTPHHI